jgi:hypothetical protein
VTDVWTHTACRWGGFNQSLFGLLNPSISFALDRFSACRPHGTINHAQYSARANTTAVGPTIVLTLSICSITALPRRTGLVG